MDLPMMRATQRHGEFVTDLARQCAILCEAKVVGVCGLPTADEARLFGDKPNVIFVSNATRFGQRERGLVDSFTAFA
jgi:hypothetical protein